MTSTNIMQYNAIPALGFTDIVQHFGGPLTEIGISPQLSVHFWNAIYQIGGSFLPFDMKENILYPNL